VLFKAIQYPGLGIHSWTRPTRIVERRRRDELEDNGMLADEDSHSDADSELSMLASSLFNGMEGIEFSGMDSGLMDSGPMDSGAMDSDDSSILGVAFSPRKTRSGKVIRYRDEK
jgi:hypothetical protein